VVKVRVAGADVWGRRGHGALGDIHVGSTVSQVLLGTWGTPRCTETGTPRTRGDRRTAVGTAVTGRDPWSDTGTRGDAQTPLGTPRTPGDTRVATPPLLQTDTVTLGTRQRALRDTGTPGAT